MEAWIKDVDYYLMPSQGAVKGYEKQYLEAYQCWRAAWEKFRSEIGIHKRLSSDGFFITHEVGALFYKGECAGLCAFSYGSLKDGPFGDHSWWEGWSPEAINKLKAISTSAIICSQFTVNPKFAGKGHVVRWKEIVSLFNVLRFEASIGDVMAGNMNLTRGVNNACGESSGATLLGEPFQYNFQGIDLSAQLVAYEKPNIQRMKDQRNMQQLCDDLWSRVIHLSEFPVVKNTVLPFRKVA